ncbi:MAG TPA: hypothetical protein VI914_00245 [Thermodesulfobacteriota bacterium]|nr:hypothetical protein [Thermodesulfobacteriota bacterium]
MLTEIQPLEHFSMMVSKAMKGQGIKASPMAEFYLSNLLTGFIDARRISGKTFSERFLKALGAEGGLKKILLKELADSSLFISGFFHESLKRKIVDVDYYMDMGIISYNMLSEFFSGNGRDYNTTLSSLYREMSEKFLKFADILDEISEESSIKTALDLLRLYERWLKTKSKRTETLLRELGIDPVSVPVRPVH